MKTPEELEAIYSAIQARLAQLEAGTYTHSQFERDKTERIKALCEAFKAAQGETDRHVVSERQQIMERLRRACDAEYKGQ